MSEDSRSASLLSRPLYDTLWKRKAKKRRQKKKQRKSLMIIIAKIRLIHIQYKKNVY